MKAKLISSLQALSYWQYPGLFYRCVCIYHFSAEKALLIISRLRIIMTSRLVLNLISAGEAGGVGDFASTRDYVNEDSDTGFIREVDALEREGTPMIT